MNSEPTRGEWKATFDGDDERFAYSASVFETRTAKLVAVCDEDLTISRAEQNANAHLIAAAPDLLEACVVLLSSTGEIDDSAYGRIDRAIGIARDAIAKAKGGVA